MADDVLAATWEKFLFIDPLSSVGAATRAPLGVMRAELLVTFDFADEVSVVFQVLGKQEEEMEE